MPPTRKPSPLEAYLKGLKASALRTKKPLNVETIVEYGLPETLPGDSPSFELETRASDFLKLLKSAIKQLPEVEQATLHETFFGEGTASDRQKAAALKLRGTAKGSAPRNYSTEAIRHAADVLTTLAREQQSTNLDAHGSDTAQNNLSDHFEHFDQRKLDSLGQLLSSSRVPFDNMEVSLTLSPGPKPKTLTLSVVEEFDTHFDRMLIMHAIARDPETDEPNELAERIYAESSDMLSTYWYMDRANFLSSFDQQLADDKHLKVSWYRRNDSGHWAQRSLKKIALEAEDIAQMGVEWDVPSVATDDMRLIELVLPEGNNEGHRRYRVASSFIVDLKPKFCYWEFDRIAYVNSVRVAIKGLDDTRFRVRFFGPAVSKHVDQPAKTWEYSVAGWCTRHNGINIHW